MIITKRNLMKSIATAAVSLPFLAFSHKAEALSTVSAATSGFKGVPVSSPEWRILGHATDGTNPSTAISGFPKFTHDILSLENQSVELTGYIQPLSGGFGKREYFAYIGSVSLPVLLHGKPGFARARIKQATYS